MNKNTLFNIKLALNLCLVFFNSFSTRGFRFSTISF